MNEAELEIWKVRNVADAAENRDRLIADELNRMTPEREAHLAEIKSKFQRDVDAKYRSGQAEHGGNVWDRNPIVDMSGELLDFSVYHNCAVRRDKRINALVVTAREALSQGLLSVVEMALDEIFRLTFETTKL